ncbi:ABC transporter substrate-binding protein [Lacisediminihabitans changchengi]|uniref:Extracellular solute-binding protein n=1 Tax=Lacisediminihabitans changchengi TaxID=2787634 RepID=A0A934SN61_9MICO|nr:extracellular solute-binding protein [Lacisediminihabitans changchengi]MBK4348460.1 extracellular solute-binding protein [Lacisediminihabitans changchengi]
MAKKHIFATAAMAVVGLALAGCSGGGASSDNTIDGKPSGEITVLTQRTDLVNTTFKDYAAEFEKAYPGVTVKFEAIKDYEGQVKTRLNTKSYGDVLAIPNTVSPNQLSTFFEPLGSIDKLSKTYRFVTEQAYSGKGYGIAITGNAQGIVYNKKVWAAAGLSDLPTTPDEFLSDLKAIKSKTDAIPLYTNYKDGWPLTQWEGNRGIFGDENASEALITDKSPWKPGKYQYVTDGILFDAVHEKLTEADPTTTDWESSKGLLGSGKVATMVLGSWAVSQMQDAAKTAGASPDDIGYMPYPVQSKGKFYSTISGDYKNAISKYSQHKAAAWAWIKWFAAKSNYSYDQGGLSPLVDGKDAPIYTALKKAGTNFIEVKVPAGKKAAWESAEVKTSEVDLYGPIYRQKMVDIARGAAPGDKNSYFAELNKAWGQAVSDVAAG